MREELLKGQTKEKIDIGKQYNNQRKEIYTDLENTEIIIVKFTNGEVRIEGNKEDLQEIKELLKIYMEIHK